MGSHRGKVQRPELLGGLAVRTDMELERNGSKGHGGSETALQKGSVRAGHGWESDLGAVVSGFQ